MDECLKINTHGADCFRVDSLGWQTIPSGASEITVYRDRSTNTLSWTVSDWEDGSGAFCQPSGPDLIEMVLQTMEGA